MSLAIVAMCLSAAARDGPVPPNAVTVEVYHVNQANYTGITNMNTADAAGDAFFDMRSLSTFYACHLNSSGRPAYPGQCTNPEEVSDNLVITKVEVLADGFAEYGECNVCENGFVPMTHPPQKCEDGTYHCRCSGSFGRDAPCPATMGRVAVAELIGGFSKYMNMNTTGPSMHWMVNLATRVQGLWYSTVTAGDCDSPDRTSCSWKLSKTVKEINATCHANLVRKKIETLGSKCFNDCPAGTTDPHTSCYIHCYYNTLLGPDSATVVNGTGGLAGGEIVQIWTDAFDTCPGTKALNRGTL